MRERKDRVQVIGIELIGTLEVVDEVVEMIRALLCSAVLDTAH